MEYKVSSCGTVVLMKDANIPERLMSLLAIDFDSVEDSPDGGLWFESKERPYFRDDIEEDMKRLAHYVESGTIRFWDTNGSRWRFYFHCGNVERQTGRVVYEASDKNERYLQREELFGTMVDVVEDWLTDDKGFTPETFPSDDREEDDEALIVGYDAALLMGKFKDVLTNYGFIKEEK